MTGPKRTLEVTAVDWTKLAGIDYMTGQFKAQLLIRFIIRGGALDKDLCAPDTDTGHGYSKEFPIDGARPNEPLVGETGPRCLSLPGGNLMSRLLCPIAVLYAVPDCGASD